MKKNRIPDNNQKVLTCLCGICLLLIVIIFYISNRKLSAVGTQTHLVTAADVVEAYAFLNQDEAVAEAASELDEPCTYGAYQHFLEYLNLWKAADLEQLTDWAANKSEPVSEELLALTRDQIAELFDTSVAGTEQEVLPITQTVRDAGMPDVDEDTQIRVLLLQGGSCVAKEIYFSANAPYTITFHGQTKEKKKHKVIRAGQLKLDIGEMAVVQSETGQVYLTDSDGNRDTLGYHGTLRITRYADGYAVVNEVAIEDYLCGVVQSEMPAYFEREALKAQAVCARTYIITQLMENNYPEYDADVDDSVRFQAYNQSAPDARVIDAVHEVDGLILTKDDLPAQTYFFSTSHGVTSGRELWELPQLDYLQPVRGNADQKTPDLSEEDVFREYIRSQNESDYDIDSSYYRWKVKLDTTSEKRTAEAETLLRRLQSSRPGDVTLELEDAQEKLGSFTKMKVLERTSSGAVRRIRLSFTGGQAELSNENLIRQVLGVWMCSLQDKDGGEITAAGSMLPSVYFYVQPVEDGIVLFGGGLGHGIGMSQYGANGMAKAGKQMEEILQTYYPGVELYQLYDGNEDIT